MGEPRDSRRAGEFASVAPSAPLLGLITAGLLLATAAAAVRAGPAASRPATDEVPAASYWLARAAQETAAVQDPAARSALEVRLLLLQAQSEDRAGGPEDAGHVERAIGLIEGAASQGRPALLRALALADLAGIEARRGHQAAYRRCLRAAEQACSGLSTSAERRQALARTLKACLDATETEEAMAIARSTRDPSLRAPLLCGLAVELGRRGLSKPCQQCAQEAEQAVALAVKGRAALSAASDVLHLQLVAAQAAAGRLDEARRTLGRVTDPDRQVGGFLLVGSARRKAGDPEGYRLDMQQVMDRLFRCENPCGPLAQASSLAMQSGDRDLYTIWDERARVVAYRLMSGLRRELAFAQIAMAEARAGDCDTAQVTLQQISAHSPFRPAAARDVIVALSGAGRFQQATELLKSLRVEPAASQACQAMAASRTAVGATADLPAWIASLPTPQQRASACLGAARALIAPADAAASLERDDELDDGAVPDDHPRPGELIPIPEQPDRGALPL